MEKGMHKLMAPFALMLAVSFTAPADVSAKDGSGKSNDAGQSKEYKNETEKADDKGGKGRGKDDGRNDDKGGGVAGSDDQLKTCYVFSSGGKLPRPVQHYITKGDEMRLLADDHMKRLAGMIYYDDTVRYPEKADDPKSYNPRYDLYSRDDRLGRKACILF
jgi:hypothetical protein